MIIFALGFHVKVLEEESRGVESVRSCWKLPLCPAESMPVDSETELLLAKAEPISDCGRASGITDLKSRKLNPAQYQQLSEERSENMREKKH